MYIIGKHDGESPCELSLERSSSGGGYHGDRPPVQSEPSHRQLVLLHDSGPRADAAPSSAFCPVFIVDARCDQEFIHPDGLTAPVNAPDGGAQGSRDAAFLL